jgi:hypothetical protein
MLPATVDFYRFALDGISSWVDHRRATAKSHVLCQQPAIAGISAWLPVSSFLRRRAFA